jgi:tetratricopeptide (TPR) repeat protein
LAGKALIQRNADGRYEVHELLRQYGQQMLARAGAADSAHAAHSRYFLHFLRMRAADLKGHRQLSALAEIEAELDNLRASWSWALASEEHEGMDSGVEALSFFFALRGRNHEGGELLWHAYQRLDDERDDVLRRRVLIAYSLIRPPVLVQGREVDNALARALASAEAHGDPAEIAACWFALGRHEEIAAHARQPPDLAAARRCLEQSLACYRALNDDFYLARIARVIARCYGHDAVTLEQHQAFHAAGLEYARRAGSGLDQVTSLGSLGWCAIDLGQFVDAERYFREAAALSSELRFPRAVVLVTLGLAFVHFCHGRMETARRLAEEGQAIAQAFNTTERESLALLMLSLVAAIAGDSTRALQLGEQSLQIGTGRHFRTYVDWTLAVVRCGLGDDELAWRHLRASHRAVQVPASVPRVLAVAAVLLGQQGDRERATELLGSVFSNRHSAHGWMEQWRPLTELRARLQSELGAAAYQALCDRGAQMDAEQLADGLLGSPTNLAEAS